MLWLRVLHPAMPLERLGRSGKTICARLLQILVGSRFREIWLVGFEELYMRRNGLRADLNLSKYSTQRP